MQNKQENRGKERNDSRMFLTRIASRWRKSKIWRSTSHKYITNTSTCGTTPTEGRRLKSAEFEMKKEK